MGIGMLWLLCANSLLIDWGVVAAACWPISLEYGVSLPVGSRKSVTAYWWDLGRVPCSCGQFYLGYGMSRVRAGILTRIKYQPCASIHFNYE